MMDRKYFLKLSGALAAWNSLIRYSLTADELIFSPVLPNALETGDKIVFPAPAEMDADEHTIPLLEPAVS